VFIEFLAFLPFVVFLAYGGLNPIRFAPGDPPAAAFPRRFLNSPSVGI
jgi:hypothetical protein